jgi:phospholipase C
VVNLLLDAFDWLLTQEFEQMVRDTVRDFLATNLSAIAAKIQATLVQLANREHVLHAIYLDGPDLVIEHYDQSERIVPELRPQLTAGPLGVPIDGPLPSDADDRLQNIEHIVVVVMENRSFDHMLGWLSHPDQYAGIRRTDIDGLTGHERIPLGGNVTGTAVPAGFAPELEWRPDPDHSRDATALQIGDGAMDGFIPAYRKRLTESDEIVKSGVLDDETRIVNGQTSATVPIYAFIAEQFCVLDRWFASFLDPPTSTACARWRASPQSRPIPSSSPTWVTSTHPHSSTSSNERTSHGGCMRET